MPRRRHVVAALVLVVLALGLIGRAAAQSDPGPTAVLSEKHFWRKHYTFFPPKVSVAAAKAKEVPADPASRAEYLSRFYHSGFDTSPPPATWREADFDDSAWQLARGRQFTFGDPRIAANTAPDHSDVYLRGTDSFVEEVGLVCQRSSFHVADPTKVRKLELSLTCRGGFVAYLNGREVARGWLPDGEITPKTAAADYPLEAFFERDTIGQQNPRYLGAFNRQWKPARDSDQWTLRERAFGPKAIATDALRKGDNVLAIELHRSDYPAECKMKVDWKAPRSLGWSPVGLCLLMLRAEAAPGAVASLSPRSGGLQVWNGDPARAIGPRECPAPGQKLRPVRIVGARNGRFAGMVLVRDEKPLAGLTVTVSALSGANGAAIPASAVEVRFGATNATLGEAGMSYLTATVPMETTFDRSGGGLGGRYDCLLEKPSAEDDATAVWITVSVPREAPAGDYAGTVTIAVGGPDAARGPVEAPVELYVADWTLPDVKYFVGLLNIYQSPDTLARYYKLKPWSAEHWAMIAKSLKLMGEAGNIGLFFPLLAESQMGNPESMVVWVEKPGGGYTYDFTVFDRYLATAMEHHNRLRFLSLNVWGSEADPKRNVPAVTARDPETGKRSLLQLPSYGTDECEQLWRPLLLAIRQRLADKGLDKLILLGLPDDCTPHWSHVAMFNNILPGVAWVRESHFNVDAYRYDLKDPAKTVPVAYNSVVWADVGGVPDPKERRLHGWQPRKGGHVVLNFNRLGTCTTPLLGFPEPWAYRQWMDATLALGRQGNGRVGGDYWHIGANFVGEGRVSSEANGGSRGTLFGIYLKSAVGQVGLGNSTTDLFGPGLDGPVTTIRFENAREGNQEAEARIFIEKALLDQARPLPAALAEQARAVLDERTSVARLYMLDADHLGWLGWQDRSRRLYDTAAKVAAARPAAR